MLTETCKFTTLFSTNIYPNIVPGKILYLHYLFIRTSHHLQSVYYMIYNYCDNEIENIKYISPLLHTFPSSLITACNIHAIFTYIHPGNSSRPSQHRWQNPHMLASQKKKSSTRRITNDTQPPFLHYQRRVSLNPPGKRAEPVRWLAWIHALPRRKASKE